jgi:hypothetical protein
MPLYNNENSKIGFRLIIQDTSDLTRRETLDAFILDIKNNTTTLDNILQKAIQHQLDVEIKHVVEHDNVVREITIK